MDNAAKEVLELIKEGATTIGKAGVDFWPELVAYHIAVALAGLLVSFMVLVIGGTLLYWANNTWIRLGKPSSSNVEIYEVCGFVGGVMSVGGFVTTVGSLYWAAIALYSPQAYTVMQLLGK